MGEPYLDFAAGKVPVITRATPAGANMKVASVFKMADGWHTKRADDHTGNAWSGPYASAEDALQRYTDELAS
jgi:hypothetical protein